MDTNNQQLTKEDQLRIQIQNFQEKLNREPDPREFQPTPDGKARTLPISFVEMTLDELFFGQWETTEPKFQQVFNEVIGTVELTVWHPITGRKITRSGWASVVITQDKDAAVMDFNLTKKKNALDLAFPKLGAEAVKNAARSLGKIFGRDINRKEVDVFKPALKTLPDEAFKKAMERAENGDVTVLPLAESNFILTDEQRTMLQGAQQNKRLN